MAHWRQMFEQDNKTLGSWDLEQDGKFVSKTVTIERFFSGDIVGSMGKVSKQMVKLKEFDKPMVCNVTNFTRLQKFFGSFEPNDYIGKQIVLTVEKVRDPSGGDQVDALRFSTRPLPKTELPALPKDKMEQAIQSVKNGLTTVDKIAQSYSLTKEQLKALNDAKA